MHIFLTVSRRLWRYYLLCIILSCIQDVCINSYMNWSQRRHILLLLHLSGTLLIWPDSITVLQCSKVSDVFMHSWLSMLTISLIFMCWIFHVCNIVLHFIVLHSHILSIPVKTGSPFPRNRTKPDETWRNRAIIVVKYVTINCYKKLLALLYSTIVIGPDFHRASGGQTGEWALMQEEQMGPQLTPRKISLNR